MESAAVNTRLVGLTAVAALLAAYMAVEWFGLSEPASNVEAPAASVTVIRSAAVKLNPLEGLNPDAFTSLKW